MRELDQTHALKDKGQGIELVKWAFFDRGGASRNQGPKKDLPPTIKTTKSEPPAHCSHLRLLGFFRLDRNFDLAKGQINSKGFLVSSISSKNEQKHVAL